MVKAEDSWLCQRHTDWDSPNVNHMSRLLPSGQQSIAPSCMNTSTFSANVAFPGFSVSGLPGLETGQINGDYGLSYFLPPLVEASLSPSDPLLEEPQSASPRGLGIKTMPNDLTSSTQKRFLIFDQSGNHVRFFLSPFDPSPRHPPIIAPVPIREQMFPTEPAIQVSSAEKQIIGEGSDFHEDSEEINALLYSDNDEYDYDDGEDGEVTSTDHSPFAIKASLENYHKVGYVTEEVASSDGSNKRHKLLDGAYKKSLLLDATNPVKFDSSREYNNDVESSCARARTKVKVMDSTFSTKKDKIHETLRILENIIPGSKSKEPLLIIDEAISYLKSLKLKAKALGLSHP